MMKTWLGVLLFFIAYLILFFVIGLVGAEEPTWRGLIRDAVRREAGTKRKTKPQITTLECYVSHYKYVWQGNKLVKVPVTVCKEK